MDWGERGEGTREFLSNSLNLTISEKPVPTKGTILGNDWEG